MRRHAAAPITGMMGWQLTLGIGVAAAALGALFGWLGARPFEPHRGPRLAPYRFMMLLCAAVVLYMIVHLVNLAGLTTGRQTPGARY